MMREGIGINKPAPSTVGISKEAWCLKFMDMFGGDVKNAKECYKMALEDEAWEAERADTHQFFAEREAEVGE